MKFFEDILEGNEGINASYINENVRQVKDEYMLYYLQATTDNKELIVNISAQSFDDNKKARKIYILQAFE